jgi:hypothetical protein
MSDGLYREFVFRSPTAWHSFSRFIKDNAQACIERGSPLRVIVTEEDADRLDEQIAYYFGIVVQSTAEQAWIGGRQYSKEVWHEQFSQMFLPQKEIVLPTGQQVLKRQSIARGHIGVRAMAKFTKEVEAYVTQELGVHLPAPREIRR